MELLKIHKINFSMETVPLSHNYLCHAPSTIVYSAGFYGGTLRKYCLHRK